MGIADVTLPRNPSARLLRLSSEILFYEVELLVPTVKVTYNTQMSTETCLV